MRERIPMILLIILILSLIAGGVYLFIQNQNNLKLIEEKDKTITELELQVANQEELGTVFVSATKLDKVGNALLPSMYEEREVPLSNIPENAITEEDFFKQDNFLKFPIEANIILTKDNFMVDRKELLTYYVDVPVEVPPTTLKIGDYVDVRLGMPLGEDYTVISNVRVYDFNKGTPVVKVVKDELIALESAIKDQEITRELGAKLYMVIVTDPGQIKQSTINYPIRRESALVTGFDTDIEDKTKIINEEQRAYLNERINVLMSPDLRTLMTQVEKGLGKSMERLTKSYDHVQEERKKEAELKALDAELGLVEEEGAEE